MPFLLTSRLRRCPYSTLPLFSHGQRIRVLPLIFLFMAEVSLAARIEGNRHLVTATDCIALNQSIESLAAVTERDNMPHGRGNTSTEPTDSCELPNV